MRGIEQADGFIDNGSDGSNLSFHRIIGRQVLRLRLLDGGFPAGQWLLQAVRVLFSYSHSLLHTAFAIFLAWALPEIMSQA